MIEDHDAHVGAYREHLLREALPLALHGSIGGPLPYMGHPARPDPTGKRGRPATKTQYDHARERRDVVAGSFRRHVHERTKLPALGKASGWLARPEYRAVVLAVRDDPRINPRNRASEVQYRCDRMGIEAPTDRDVIRRHLGKV